MYLASKLDDILEKTYKFTTKKIGRFVMPAVKYMAPHARKTIASLSNFDSVAERKTLNSYRKTLAYASSQTRS